jgi:FtsP/CotA-like multicopper oxidase with cupredoxin domain
MKAWPRIRAAALMVAMASPLPFLFQGVAHTDAPWDDIDLGGLPEIRARNGVLNTTLTATPHVVTIGNIVFPGAIYNGSYPGPVLRVHPGDFVHIKLVNQLSGPTNLHFHGFRVTPEGSGDNIHIEVPPHASFDYAFRVPTTQPPGLFWYHDHLHGLTESHVDMGLSGAFLVEGFAKDFGGLDGIAEKLLLIKDVSFPGCQGPVLKTELHCRVITVNGRADWADAMRPGETKLWRICNQGANLWAHLAVQGAGLRIIGRDGTPAERATETDAIDVMPASRMDVLVTATGSGAITLISKNMLTGSGKMLKLDRVIGTVSVAGQQTAAKLSPIGFPRQKDLRDGPVSAHRTIDFTEESEAGKYFIDGKMYDHLRIDQRVPFGTVEEWTVRNRTDDFHEFHIHQLGFQVIEINGAKQNFNGYLDDVNVPSMGEVKLLIPFTDPVLIGHFVYHCHVLKHEDHGMMANIEVYRQTATIWQHICRFVEPRRSK